MFGGGGRSPLIETRILQVKFRSLSSCISKISFTPPKFLKILKKPFDHLRNPRIPHPQNYFRMLTSRSQIIWLPKVKIYHRKLTFGS